MTSSVSSPHPTSRALRHAPRPVPPPIAFEIIIFIHHANSAQPIASPLGRPYFRTPVQRAGEDCKWASASVNPWMASWKLEGGCGQVNRMGQPQLGTRWVAAATLYMAQACARAVAYDVTVHRPALFPCLPCEPSHQDILRCRGCMHCSSACVLAVRQ